MKKAGGGANGVMKEVVVGGKRKEKMRIGNGSVRYVYSKEQIATTATAERWHAGCCATNQS
jgi:hypothetical protein